MLPVCNSIKKAWKKSIIVSTRNLKFLKSGKTESQEFEKISQFMNFACVKVLLTHLKVAYTNPYVLKWSLWVAFATCGYFQVGNYIQALWKYIETEDNPENYNGAVEATATLIGIYRTCTFTT